MMNLSVKRFFEQHGVLFEMKDWKSHFLAGTKGMKKTDPIILDYVENLLDTVYTDKEKVKNNRLAPWLVAQVSQIGVENIGTDDRNKFITVIEWVKEVGGEGNIPKMNLQQAHEFSVAALEKRGKMKQAEKRDDKPAQEIPETEDEKAGLIKRVWVVPDGSGRMWVKVLEKKWLNSKCEKEGSWGIGCQVGDTHGWTPSTYNIYSLIGPPKGNPQGQKTTLVSMGVHPQSKGIEEMRQEGNQSPGSQTTSGGWSDVAEQVINFIAFSSEAKKNIDKFNNYQTDDELAVNPNAAHNPYGGGAGAMWDIMNLKPELFNKLVTVRPEIKESNRNLILSHHKFGKKWYESFGVDVEKYAKENPVKFIENLEYYDFLGNKVGEILEKINIDKIVVKHSELILSKIDKLLEVLSADMFKKVIDAVNISQYITTSFDKFKDTIKLMSAAKNPKYKELMAEIVSKNISTIMQSSGGGIVGLYAFLDFVSMPKMHRFSRKDTDGQIYAIKKITVVDPITGDRTTTEEEFPLRDDLSILPQKERRKIIENNKELLKSSFTGTDEEKEMKYLRILFRETNPQDVERTLKAEKDNFIRYYDNHPSKVTGYPGILEFYSVMNRNKAGYISSKNTLGGNRKVYFKMDLDDLRQRDVQKKLLAYYFQKSKATNPTAKKYEAIEDFLNTMETSGDSKEVIVDIAKKEFSPKQVVGKIPTLGDYSMFISMMSKFLDKTEMLNLIATYKDEIVSSGITGSDAYKNMLIKYSERGYNVKAGDKVMYNKKMPEDYSSEDDDKIYLTRGLKYTVTDTRDSTDTRNYMIKVIDDTKKESWHYSSDFDLKIVNLQESVRKYVFKKILESYSKKIMENKNKKPNYSAVVLDEKSRSKLLEKFEIPEGWHKIAHHMTINMGCLSDKSLLGKDFNMRVTAIAGNDKVIAVQVETDAPSAKTIKHITLAVNKEAGGKPAMSNALTNWQPVRAPFFIKGTVNEVCI